LAAAAWLVLATISPARAQSPFLSADHWSTLRAESSGAAPYENLRALTRLHRVPATAEFDQAAELMLARAKEYGLKDARAEQFPIDGKIHYGLMRSHLAWRVDYARMWQVAPQHALIGDWSTEPIRLADYSHSADVEAGLVDVGAGTAEQDYAGKDVRGKIVLADGVLSAVQRLAVVQHGAAGIISDMPNQSTAWSGLDSSIVRWGHLDATLPRGFAFMVSRAGAAALRAQLAAGQAVTIRAQVQAEVGPGHWTVVSGIIPGSDASAGDIVYSCHLDHQRPGANDNGSGCVTILESARILARLIGAGTLPRPKRTLRFIWGPEVEGTMAYLSRHPDVRAGLRADIHMDMVGGDPFKNKSVLHVTETPWSLPTFVTDIGDLFAETLRDAAAAYTEDGEGKDAAVIEDRDGASGSRNAFLVDETPYAEGSDHDDYDSSTIAVPALYLRDWPDIYIHTDHDSLEQIDATKLRRVALLGAASGYVLAALDATQSPDVLPFLCARALARMNLGFERAQRLAQSKDLAPAEASFEARNVVAGMLRREQAALKSFAAFSQSSPSEPAMYLEALERQAALMNDWLLRAAAARGAPETAALPAWHASAAGTRVPVRIGDFGPLTYQNDDVLHDRLGADRVRQIKLLNPDASHLLNAQDRGAIYAYEIVNFVDGKRTVAEIRDAVAAELGSLPLDLVDDYLQACAEAKIIAFK
jgi:hypothetical protein